MMTALEQKTLDIYRLLPEHEQILAYELIKRLVLAWDSDFTKLTHEERERLEKSDIDFKNGDTVDISDIDW